MRLLETQFKTTKNHLQSEKNRCQLHISCSIPVTYCNKYHNCASLFSDRLTISEFTILRNLADQKSQSHTHMALQTECSKWYYISIDWWWFSMWKQRIQRDKCIHQNHLTSAFPQTILHRNHTNSDRNQKKKSERANYYKNVTTA